MIEQYSFDDFVKNVEKLKSTVEIFKKSSNITEENTIFKVITPMFMNVLKYTNDVLEREYQLENRKDSKYRVDFAYVKNDKPLIFIECKNIDITSEKLTDEFYKQLEDYCQHKKFQYDVKLGILTNGVNYQFYAKTDMNKQHELDEESYFDFNVMNYTKDDLYQLYEHRIGNIDNKIKHNVDLVIDQKMNEHIYQMFASWKQGTIDNRINDAIFYVARDSDLYRAYIPANKKDDFSSKINEALKKFVDDDKKTEVVNISVCDTVSNVTSNLNNASFEYMLVSSDISKDEKDMLLNLYNTKVNNEIYSIRVRDNFAQKISVNILSLYLALRKKIRDSLDVGIKTTISKYVINFEFNDNMIFNAHMFSSYKNEQIKLGMRIEFLELAKLLNIKDILIEDLGVVYENSKKTETSYFEYNGVKVRDLKGVGSLLASINTPLVEFRYNSVEQLDDIVALIKQNYDRLSKQ